MVGVGSLLACREAVFWRALVKTKRPFAHEDGRGIRGTTSLRHALRRRRTQYPSGHVAELGLRGNGRTRAGLLAVWAAFFGLHLSATFSRAGLRRLSAGGRVFSVSLRAAYSSERAAGVFAC